MLRDVILATVFPCFLAFAAYAQTDSSVKRAISNVEAAEEIYKNIEVKEELSYQLGKESAADHPKALRVQTRSLRSIKQDGFTFLDRRRTEKLLNGKGFHAETIAGYDGDRMRRLENNHPEGVGSTPAVNVSSEREEDCDLFRPHTWLLSKAFMCFPLSLWLRGGDELSNDPRSAYANWVQKTVLEKEESIEGLWCVKLRCETWNRGAAPKLNTRRFLWLAVDKNYLPVRTEGYSFHSGWEVPGEVGWAKDFREVESGIWLPFKREIRVFDAEKLRKTKVQITDNVTQAIIKMVDLHPNYPKEFFADIPMAPGTVVYEIENRKIVNSFKIEKERWWYVVVIALFGLISVVLLLRVVYYVFARKRETRK